MAGLSSLLREALQNIAEQGERGGSRGAARTVSRALGPKDTDPWMVMDMLAGNGYGAPKSVSWSLTTPMSEPESAVQRAIHNIYDERMAMDVPVGTPDPTLNALLRKSERMEEMGRRETVGDSGLPLNRKIALPAFRAAREALMEDMATRSPFEPWTPNSGYSFYGLTPTHEKIYERMVASAKHPDYFVQKSYDPELDRTIYNLRRRFPFRHEVAAGAGLGVLGYASNAGDSE